MTLLPPTALDNLPKIGSQRDKANPYVRERLLVPDHPWEYYIIEGERRGNDFLVFGLLIDGPNIQDIHWRTYSLASLQARYPHQLTYDPKFTGGSLTDVVSLPEECDLSPEEQ